jgi:sulfoxide reductase heme-binding subunit YedZ
VLGVIHYYWLVKSDVTLPFRFAAILVVLLGLRAVFWWQARQSRMAASAVPKSSPAAAAR